MPDDVPPARIVLHGRLRTRFGSEYRFAVSTPAGAVYALCRMVPGFQQELSRGAYRVRRGGPKTGLALDETDFAFRLDGRPLHIFPAAVGRAKGNGGSIVKIILGVVMIAAAVAPAGGALGVTGAAGAGFLGLGNTFLGVSAGAWGLMGASLLFSGIGGILTHMPKPPAPNASFLLSGPLNPTQQGGPVPLAYGRKVRVGSTVISAGYQAIPLVPGTAEPSSNSSSPGNLFGISPLDFNNPNQVNVGQRIGTVTSVTVTNGGAGYTGPNVFFVNTDSSGYGASCTATLSGGVIIGITVTNGGSNYASAPLVSITDPHGRGASATATVVAQDV